MLMFSETEHEAFQTLLKLALAEDLGTAGDRTSSALIGEEVQAAASFVARVPGVVAGLAGLELVAQAFPETIQCEYLVTDGASIQPGDRLARYTGQLRAILAAERTVLNFLQRLSGIATLTHQYVDAVAGTNCQILDTRKTTPGWRLLEKYAVRAGGGTNHRIGLYDAILIKDNHLAGLGGDANALVRAVELARDCPDNAGLLVQIEVDNLAQLEAVLPAKPDMVLLDNMPPDQLGLAVATRNWLSPETILEASGGITLETIRAVAETGVDRISVGALTHSAKALDIGLDFEP